MSETTHTPNLEAWKGNRSDGNWETYWRAGFRVEGQAAIVVEKYCRTEVAALRQAEDAAKEHHKALVDVGAFAKVEAFIQRWRTQSRGNREEFDSATISTRIVLNPPRDITPAEAIKRARVRAADVEASAS